MHGGASVEKGGDPGEAGVWAPWEEVQIVLRALRSVPGSLTEPGLFLQHRKRAEELSGNRNC